MGNLLVKVWNCRLIQCDDVFEASDIVSQYILSNDLGSSKWCNKTNGNVYDNYGNKIAKISYNGRIWALNGKEIKK